MGLLRVIKKEDHNSAKIVQILNLNKQIKFVSLMGVDLGGNATDEKIPVELFKKDIDDFLYRGIQTDGSSVELHEIATLNNAKVDLLPDLDVNWYRRLQNASPILFHNSGSILTAIMLP